MERASFPHPIASRRREKQATARRAAAASSKDDFIAASKAISLRSAGRAAGNSWPKNANRSVRPMAANVTRDKGGRTSGSGRPDTELAARGGEVSGR